jgi:hypothetical protein
VSFHLLLGLLHDVFSLVFPYKTQYTLLICPVSATCLAHLFILHLIILIILSEEYKLWSCLLMCSKLLELIVIHVKKLQVAGIRCYADTHLCIREQISTHWNWNVSFIIVQNLTMHHAKS